MFYSPKLCVAPVLAPASAMRRPKRKSERERPTCACQPLEASSSVKLVWTESLRSKKQPVSWLLCDNGLLFKRLLLTSQRTLLAPLSWMLLLALFRPFVRLHDLHNLQLGGFRENVSMGSQWVKVQRQFQDNLPATATTTATTTTTPTTTLYTSKAWQFYALDGSAAEGEKLPHFRVKITSQRAATF